MVLSVATWNINSVRLRIRIVTDFLKNYAPDILCLQEIKCSNDAFPAKAFRKRGYTYIALNGQRGYHGVAIVSRIPFLAKASQGFCGKNDARHVTVTIADGAGGEIDIHNFYVPAGGDEPDPAVNPKFAHKLSFLEEMRSWLAGPRTARAAIMVGDLNVAPMEHDVWSHKQLLRVVSHTPGETERLEAVRATGWIDAIRHFVPAEEKLYTWWSYRAHDWEASNRGRRLDHVWITPPLAPCLEGMEIVRIARGWKRPSDHVPVIARFAASGADREQSVLDPFELADGRPEASREPAMEGHGD
jgi:exodeoxyribonuclease-3